MPPSAPKQQQPYQLFGSDTLSPTSSDSNTNHTSANNRSIKNKNEKSMMTSTSNFSDRISATQQQDQQMQQQQQQQHKQDNTGEIYNNQNFNTINHTATNYSSDPHINPFSPTMNINYSGLNTGINGNGFLNNPFLNSMSSMMMPSPYYNNGAMLSPSTVVGPFSTITNYLLGIQNVIMSIGQVIQIVSMNASSLQQLSEALIRMLEHAMHTYQEQFLVQQSDSVIDKNLSLEEIEKRTQHERRKRIVIRYAITIVVSYIGYTTIRRLFQRKQQQQLEHYPHNLSSNYYHHPTPYNYHDPNNPYIPHPLPPPQHEQQPHFHNNSNYYNTASVTPFQR